MLFQKTSLLKTGRRSISSLLHESGGLWMRIGNANGEEKTVWRNIWKAVGRTLWAEKRMTQIPGWDWAVNQVPAPSLYIQVPPKHWGSSWLHNLHIPQACPGSGAACLHPIHRSAAFCTLAFCQHRGQWDPLPYIEVNLKSKVLCIGGKPRVTPVSGLGCTSHSCQCLHVLTLLFSLAVEREDHLGWRHLIGVGMKGREGPETVSGKSQVSVDVLCYSHELSYFLVKIKQWIPHFR